MLSYILARIAHSILTLAVMAVVIFCVTQALPGDVARIMAGQFASQETIDAFRVEYGLDRPLPLQFLSWAQGFLSGNLGKSQSMDLPIAPVLVDALQKSLIVAGLAFAIVVIAGIGLGVLAAVRQGRIYDHAASFFSYLGISVPEFCWGIALILVFADWLRWLPSGGYGEPGEGFWNSFLYLMLPTATLAFTLIAHVLRMMRSSMIDEMGSAYVRTARAKGVPKRAVIFRHALPNAMLPTIAVLAMDIGWLMGGVVTVEVVFSYPGIGRLLMFAIERRDLPLIQAAILVIAAIYCLANLVADVASAMINPKVRSGHAH